VSLRSRLRVLEKRAAALLADRCECDPGGGFDVVYEGYEEEHPGSTDPEPAAPQDCPRCGRRRGRIIV
jgi:hypothetical protein